MWRYHEVIWVAKWRDWREAVGVMEVPVRVVERGESGDDIFDSRDG